MTPSSCDHCQGPPIVWQRYSGAHLCARHLRDSVETRVRKDLAKQAPLPRGTRLAIAFSGGKDSTTALQLMADLRDHRPDVELMAVTIDEGIAGYRPPALEITAESCRTLRIEHVVKRVQDFAGLTMDQVHARDGELGQCGYCGVFRRRLMNDAAKEVRADRLVTGHNLDDVAQTILMNLSGANLDQLLKMGPHEEAKDGLVPRLMPLRTIPESEVYLYAFTRGLRWHDEECPYSIDAQRQVYRDVLYRLEETRPGTRHALLRVQEELRPLLAQARPAGAMKECIRCGEPTSGNVCKACEFRERFLVAPV